MRGHTKMSRDTHAIVLPELRKETSTEELTLLASYDVRECEPCIDTATFPVRSRFLARRVLEFVRMTGPSFTTQQALGALRRKNLTRPVYEDCLRMGVHAPALQMKRPYLFIHTPVCDTYLVLAPAMRHGTTGRGLYGFYVAKRWPAEFIVVGVRRSAPG